MPPKTFLYSIAQTVRDRALEYGVQPVFSFKSKEISYIELDTNSNQAANGLLAHGLEKGDRIAYLGKNSPAYFELIAAVAKTQTVITPINWRLAGPELTYVLNDCNACLLYTSPSPRDLSTSRMPSSA